MPEACIAYGGTAPAAVREQLDAALARLSAGKARLASVKVQFAGFEA